jgi:hypothetical protein
MQIDPMTGQPVMQSNSPADMDVDIVIDSTPDTAVIQEEQFQRLAELVQAGMPIPPDVLIEASSLPKKKLLLDKLKQAQEQQSQQPDMAMQAEMQKAQMQSQAKQQELAMQAQADAQDLERQDMADQRKTERAMQLADLQFKYDMARLEKQAEIDGIREENKVRVSLQAETAKRQIELETDRAKKQLDFDFADADRQSMLTTEVAKGQAMAQAQAPAIDSLHKRLDQMGDALMKLARPKRIVKDPVTGEKRAEFVN